MEFRSCSHIAKGFVWTSDGFLYFDWIIHALNHKSFMLNVSMNATVFHDIVELETQLPSQSVISINEC